MKQVPIGIENFKTLIDDNYYYVDKSNLIKDLLGKMVVLYTRPRRFGKTLNMSMLNYFYNIKEKENAYLFNGLDINKDDEVMKHQNKYPVIFLSLKDMRKDTFERQIEKFESMVSKIIKQYTELLSSSQLDEFDKKMLLAYRNRESSRNDVEDALLNISECLEKYYGEKVVILIDEYDVPLQYAYIQGYYDEMANFLRNVFSAALKTNSSLQLGVLTGCLRIAKESIFTGLNNCMVYSILDYEPEPRYGFTEKEVETMLDAYGFYNHMKEVKRWYDGYMFGEHEVYNPWSTTMYIEKQLMKETQQAESFWANTSSNDLVIKYIKEADRKLREEFDVLVNNGSIIKKIKPELTYREMDEIDNIYSFLLFTGYLKIGNTINREENIYELKIPNNEVRKVYTNQFEQYFKEYQKEHKHEFMNALESEDTNTINEILNDILFRSASYYDNKESFYHGFILGLLSDYEVLSNEEAGSGRLDLVVRPKKPSGKVVIIECKYARCEDDLIKECENAIQQIKEKRYMEKPAYQIYGGIIGYGISFYKKRCYVLKSL